MGDVWGMIGGYFRDFLDVFVLCFGNISGVFKKNVLGFSYDVLGMFCGYFIDVLKDFWEVFRGGGPKLKYPGLYLQYLEGMRIVIRLI